MIGHTVRKKGTDSQSRSSNALNPKIFPQKPSAPATEEDKVHWRGFCEIESEPVCTLDRLRR